MPRSRPPRRRARAEAPSPPSELEASDPERQGFLPEVLDRTVIAIPLLRQMEDPKRKDALFDVAIDLNLDFEGGRQEAAARVQGIIDQVTSGRKRARARRAGPHVESAQYVFESLDAAAIRDLVRVDSGGGEAPWTKRAIYHVWPDFKLKRLTNKSVSTVKADAAHNAFAALGDGIVWAVVDSGIDGTHPHFKKHRNLVLPEPLQHRDFTATKEQPLVDAFGHGTHVAGIIAGEMRNVVAITRHRNERGDPVEVPSRIPALSGMAPRAKLLSLKVLDAEGRDKDAKGRDKGTGHASGIIAALEYIQKINGYGRRLLIQGVNLSVGYDFQPEWFACGQSPLCVEVDRLVKSGVVVVVAAGNSGYGFVDSAADAGPVAAGLDLTINDPGNADLAITVGSTHRDMPHVYGVSYFSSKGPTGDGRMKPDLLAPGEKIISCDSRQRIAASSTNGRARRRDGAAPYREDSGTSMAAPHVSGVIAAFLSIRREFIGRPEDVKRIFLSTATDLHRAPYFQGRGLVDVMRAIQSV